MNNKEIFKQILNKTFPYLELNQEKINGELYYIIFREIEIYIKNNITNKNQLNNTLINDYVINIKNKTIIKNKYHILREKRNTYSHKENFNIKSEYIFEILNSAFLIIFFHNIKDKYNLFFEIIDEIHLDEEYCAQNISKLYDNLLKNNSFKKIIEKKYSINSNKTKYICEFCYFSPKSLSKFYDYIEVDYVNNKNIISLTNFGEINILKSLFYKDKDLYFCIICEGYGPQKNLLVPCNKCNQPTVTKQNLCINCGKWH